MVVMYNVNDLIFMGALWLCRQMCLFVGNAQ